jgi:UDP-N-acetylmuramyl tripeptide synthase
VLNLAPDHLDWHGSLEAYAADKGKIFAPGTLAVVNVDDEWSTRLGERSERSVGFTLGSPRAGQLGLVEDLLVDRAFTADPVREAAELAQLSDVRPYAPHNVANALAAAALARAFGVPAEFIRDGLRAFTPDPHLDRVDRRRPPEGRRRRRARPFVRRPPARSRPHGPRPRTDRDGTCATRAECPGGRCPRHRHWGDGSRRDGGHRARAAR